MSKLLIIGAGGCGREVFQWAKDMQNHKKLWDKIGFLDDNLNALDRYGLSSMMVGTISDHVPDEGEEYVCAVADPAQKIQICQSFKNRGARFVNIIHPSVIIADYSTIGEGVILCPRVIVSINVNVGNHVLMNSFSVAGHDVTLERGCTLSAQCDLMGHVYLEEEVFLGSGARIFPGKRVGRCAKIGAGSVVIRNVPANVSVFGNPARRIE